MADGASDGCKYCEIIKKKQNLLYEDDKVIAVIPANPITRGHVQVISKEHHNNIQSIEDKDVEHIFYAASFSATALFENLEAHGTNIIANSGSLLKEGGHFHIDVIARKNDDKLNFIWKPKKLSEDELKGMQSKIKDKCDLIGHERKNEVVNLDKKPEKLESGEEKAPETNNKEHRENDKSSENPEKNKTELEKKGLENKESEKKDLPETAGHDNESYMIRQLRRIP
ncbi:MAG: HIT family protein [Candidatus Woesearchaeota archaeon]